ncbi:MAG: hypothetical protein GXP56_12625 [Deltaproteobacteria bacterium]|nr:hypothetical protein [Deltaproteobacteria bacterium]
MNFTNGAFQPQEWMGTGGCGKFFSRWPGCDTNIAVTYITDIGCTEAGSLSDLFLDAPFQFHDFGVIKYYILVSTNILIV